ncbi:MAG: NAD(P)-dependent oxidoreductase [Bacteroides sp.]|nr:NAD(P)-dependent oxidoreductase [Bacteroides sp.]
MKRVFLTGATGVMGMAAMRRLTAPGTSEKIHLTVLARDSKTNRRKLAPFMEKGVEVIWGDLLNGADVGRGVAGADIVLHVGGMVSPMADWKPKLTLKVNTVSMHGIISAALQEQCQGRNVRVVYIGSVSQYGNRPERAHWGRAGDPISVSAYDAYALSKCEAERMLAESGLKEWVSLRQTGIMYPGILMKASDPISFHVPVRGCLEWVTDEQSGRLLANLCTADDIPGSFWCGFYNIGGGETYRVTNYDFLNMTLEAVGCPPAYKAFERNWFATRNFHGMWYTDSDALEELLHFRGRETFPAYMARIRKELPWYFRLAPLAPAVAIKAVMKRVALTKGLGTLYWLRTADKGRIRAAFGSMEEYRRIPSWEQDREWRLSRRPGFLNHGYDEKRPFEELTLGDYEQAALYRGGECLGPAEGVGIGADQPMRWRCSEGHEFELHPRTVLKGGHWCPECLRRQKDDPEALYLQAAANPFLDQIVNPK